MRRGCTVPTQLPTWPSTKKSDGTEQFATAGSVDGCRVLQPTQFVGTHLYVSRTWVLSAGGFLPPLGAAGEMPEFDIKPPFLAPLLIFPRGYLLKCFPQVDTSPRQRGFRFRVFSYQGQLLMAVESHLPVCQCFRWQLVPSTWFFSNDQVIRPHHSYRPPRELLMGTPRTRLLWSLQLSGARWVENGDDSTHSTEMKINVLSMVSYYLSPKISHIRHSIIW